MMLLLLLTLATVVNADVDCPTECKCVQEMSQIKCNNRNITDTQLLTMKFPRYHTLDLSDNKLTKLPSIEFWGNQSFYFMTLSGNHLTMVPQFPPVEIVSLSRNQISGVLSARNLSLWCNTTTDMFLDYNQITGIEGYAFFNCTALSRLTIGQNKIGNNIRRESFNSSSLTYLLLSENEIETLPAKIFYATPYLQRLLLTTNNLTHIPANMFIKPPIEMLFLSNNKIRSIEKNVFGSQIKDVYLGDNKLETLDVNWFTQPWAQNGTVFLNENPLKCSCELAKNATEFGSYRKMVGECAGVTRDQSRVLMVLKYDVENCTKCNFVTCQNKAECNAEDDESFNCNCTQDFKGQFCERPKTACDYKPCRNDAQCNVLKDNATLPDEFSCECTRGYKGKTCSDVDQCYKDGKNVCDKNNKGNNGANLKPSSPIFVAVLFVFSQLFIINIH